jgi:hypothetical protein
MQDSSIDKDKLNIFLSSHNQEQKDNINKIIENTKYVKKQGLVDGLLNVITQFHNIHQLYNLYIPFGKIGSEHWILTELKYFLNPIQVIYEDMELDFDLDVETVKKVNVNNDYPIIIIDDAIYSAVNMCQHVDNLRCHGIKNHVYTLVYATTSYNTQFMTDEYFQPASIISYMNMENLTIEKMFPIHKDDDYMYNNFDCQTQSVIPLYFDHKIANNFGSYQFYHKIIKNPVNREHINNITEKDILNLTRCTCMLI